MYIIIFTYIYILYINFIIFSIQELNMIFSNKNDHIEH